jgi:hypothetical protein
VLPSAKQATSSWHARTESDPPADDGGAVDVTPSTEFENRMKNAIGTPEQSSRTGQESGAAQGAAGASKQETQAKKPAPPAPNQSNGLFDWLR